MNQKTKIMAKDMITNPWTLWLNKQHRKVHEEKWNILSCVVGLPRTGKSVFATSMCKLLNPDFNVKNDVVYTEKQFRRRIQQIEDTQKIGDTVVWDEAGVGMSARDWYKIQNKEIGKMLQTMGHLRPIIWFVTPDASYIDSQARKLFHFFFEVTGRTTKYSTIRPFNIKVNKRTGKILYIYPRMSKTGGNDRMPILRFHKPPQHFIDEYDQHSNPQKMKLRESQSNLIDSGGKKRKESYRDGINRIQSDIINNPDVYQNDKGKFDRDIIYLHYKKDLTKSQATGIAKVCDKKLIKKKNPLKEDN